MEWCRNASIWKYFANYFPIKLVKTAELDPNTGNYLLGSHPHGIIGIGAYLTFGTNAAGWPKIFPNLIPSLVTLRVFHLLPGFHEIGSFLGDCMIIIFYINNSYYGKNEIIFLMQVLVRLLPKILITYLRVAKMVRQLLLLLEELVKYFVKIKIVLSWY